MRMCLVSPVLEKPELAPTVGYVSSTQLLPCKAAADVLEAELCGDLGRAVC